MKLFFAALLSTAAVTAQAQTVIGHEYHIYSNGDVPEEHDDHEHGHTHDFATYEVDLPDGFSGFAPNENVPTWGAGNSLGDGANITYSFAQSDFECVYGGSCHALADYIPTGYETVMHSAFSAWSDVANINFTFVNDLDGDIVLSSEDLDSVGQVLANASTWYEVTDNGSETTSRLTYSEIHFDNENWTINGNGVDLYTVAVHEIGHALGLGHTDEIDAIMYAYYTGPNTLHHDDIEGVQYLYGAAPVPEPSTLALMFMGLAGLMVFRKKAIA